MSSPLPQRKSPRLQGYDYSQSGLYFVTICTDQKRHLFGKIVNENMELNELGQIAEQDWLALPAHYSTLMLDMFVIMPNHMHGIILLDNSAEYNPTLGTVLGTYKAGVTRRSRSLQLVVGKIWQSRYHDHIIRHSKALDYIRDYVQHNPLRWQKDIFYNS